MAEHAEKSPQTGPAAAATGQLRRELGVGGAVMLGLGSIVGTGVFVSIALGAGVTGPAVVLAIVLAAALATCNGLSSAQLAAAHPVAGGTYEYGHQYLSPALGFTAGWMFLAAKSASAATAALGCVGYTAHLFAQNQNALTPLFAVGIVVAITALVLTGIRRSSAVNITIVTITLIALGAFILIGLPGALRSGDHFTPFFNPAVAGSHGHTVPALLHATALMFVAYTGYGRIATLGEEVHHPKRTIPIAIIVTLGVSAALYVGVSFVGVGTLGAAGFAEAGARDAAPLEIAAQRIAGESSAWRWLVWLISLGAITAMLGVLLNLVLGLSRVALAMGRRGDMPRGIAHVTAHGNPAPAIVLVAAIIAALVSLGSVKATWSFSAFTVLVYYGITNAAALRLPVEARLYPRVFAWLGLIGCLFLAFWVEPVYWGAGLALIAVGLVWHFAARRLRGEAR